MSKQAYLVAWVNPTTEQVERTGIYGGRFPTPSKNRHQPAVLCSAHGESYEDAVKQLCRDIAKDRGARPEQLRTVGWAYDLLRDDDKQRVDKYSPACPHCGCKLPEAPAARSNLLEAFARVRKRIAERLEPVGDYERVFAVVCEEHDAVRDYEARPRGQVGQ